MKKLTTAFGGCRDNQNIQTAGPRGLGLLQDVWFLEKLAHFDREVMPQGSVAVRHCGRIRLSNYMKTGMSKSKTSLPTRIGKLLKRLHYPLDVILVCVRWYVAYALSLRNLEEMMAERGVNVDHSTVHRWVIKLMPLFEKAFRQYKRPVEKSWRMDETYVKVAGQWKYLYRAVDKAGSTVDFLLRARRDKVAARRYFERG